MCTLYMQEGGGRGGGAGFSSPMDMFNMMFGGGMGGKESTFLFLLILRNYLCQKNHIAKKC